jgi:hypothetical protein
MDGGRMIYQDTHKALVELFTFNILKRGLHAPLQYTGFADVILSSWLFICLCDPSWNIPAANMNA